MSNRSEGAVTTVSIMMQRGQLALTKNAAGEYVTVRKDASVNDILITVFDTGKIMNSTTFDEVRGRASRG